MTKIGLGDPYAKFKVYIGNRVNFTFSNQSEQVSYLTENEIYACGQACGNGWRKVFNVYAKLVYATALPELLTQNHITKKQLESPTSLIGSWQEYRDTLLLREHSNTALLYSPVDLHDKSGVHIVMGKTYANSLDLPNDLTWLNHEFAVSSSHSLIVCPYFDYRQLSNVKILFLVDLILDVLKPQY